MKYETAVAVVAGRGVGREWYARTAGRGVCVCRSIRGACRGERKAELNWLGFVHWRAREVAAAWPMVLCPSCCSVGVRLWVEREGCGLVTPHVGCCVERFDVGDGGDRWLLGVVVSVLAARGGVEVVTLDARLFVGRRFLPFDEGQFFSFGYSRDRIAALGFD